MNEKKSVQVFISTHKDLLELRNIGKDKLKRIKPLPIDEILLIAVEDLKIKWGGK